MIKKTLLIFLLLITVCFTSGYKTIEKYTINAEKDAFYHNNVGINYLKDRIYYGAIQEFKIAISLSPSTQATSVFKNNLGETYMYIGYPSEARNCFEEALKMYNLNFKYYINLVRCYKELHIIKTKINELNRSNNLYDRILLGIIYVETGEIRKGVNILDEIASTEPDLIISSAIKQYIKESLQKL